MTATRKEPAPRLWSHNGYLLFFFCFCPSFFLVSLLLNNWEPLYAINLASTSTELGDLEKWSPPLDWDPVNAVYTDFLSIESRFNSSITSLLNTESTGEGAQIYDPYPNYRSPGYIKEHGGELVPCYGPRGFRFGDGPNDKVTAYTGSPKGFPEGLLGSSRSIGIDQSVCFERFGRFSRYGLQPSLQDPLGTPELPVDWTSVDWGALQRVCVDENRERFDLQPRPKPGERVLYDMALNKSGTKRSRKRTAVLFRSYDGMKYTPDLLRTMRSVITELCLASGGEYVAFLLVHVKNKRIPIFEDPEIYDQIIAQNVPVEFWNITVLWNEELWVKLYPFLSGNVINVHISQWLPIQWFATNYPNFDHYWNWEMDVRYTGHHYELLESLDSWSKKQPRKGLWERNSRFWVPSLHGNYSQFTSYVQDRYVTGPRSNRVDTSLWGPQLPCNQSSGWDIDPPEHSLTPAEDDFKWGVGEDADLITLLPMFNPDTTHYAFRDAHYNYPPAPDNGIPPRRTTIITFFRLSNRLLSTMHYENTRTPGHHMSSETWPQSVALHHGLKAVYAPHSIFMERDWPAEAANFIFNNGDSQRIIQGFEGLPLAGEGSGGWESVFGLGREHNFQMSTWYYRTSLANRLYKRFLGHEVDGIGGDEWEKKHGAYCLPPMLLHQIKDIEDPANSGMEITDKI